MKRFKLDKFGPIDSANITFGDLTILVGEQASGKSLFLQMMKYAVDCDAIGSTLADMSYYWGDSVQKFMNLYLGEGMGVLAGEDTSMSLNSKKIPMRVAIPKRKAERVMYVPAQRILSIVDGRPHLFSEFSLDTPYVLRKFSDELRLFLLNDSDHDNLFPKYGLLPRSVSESFDCSIFHSGRVSFDESKGQRKLSMKMGDRNVPFMAWSAGQKEFMPLLLAFYKLASMGRASDTNIETIVIEEPEMGLHTKAIVSVLTEIVNLMLQGYQVIVSTHSDVILQFAWAFAFIGRIADPAQRAAAMSELLNSSVDDAAMDIICSKDVRTYAFYRDELGVRTKNISSLDAFSNDALISDWGGLSQFANLTEWVVAKYSPYINSHE